MKRFCQACPDCQKTLPKPPPPAPLIPLPIKEVPFERIGMDLVGPLPKSARGHKHILVVVDYATRYPEAIPLRKATAKNIAHELFLLFSRDGIPMEILTDQGTPFMSRLMADPGLSAEQKAELQHLIGQFSDVFSSVPGKTQLVRHDIKTPPGVIVKQQPYRIPEAHRQAIEEEIQQMLKLGVIEPSRSPWSSPIVLVPKPDGTLRFCNDFRRLPNAPSGRAFGSPGKGPIYFHTGPDKRLLAGTPLGQCQTEDSFFNPKWPLAIPDPSLRPSRGTRNVPEAHGHRPSPTSAVRKSVPRRCCYPFGALGGPLRPPAEGAYGALKGLTHRQP